MSITHFGSVANFHLRDNWFFTRHPDGSVSIASPSGDALTVPPEEWASTVAAMWHQGETHATYEHALDLQRGTLILGLD